MFVVVLICFAVSGLLIYGYVTASFRLLELVQERADEIWQKLGRPERVWVRGTDGGGMHTIQPLAPWLGWVWRAQTAGLDRTVARELGRTSRLLKLGLSAFGATAVSLLALVTQSS